jgi:hypothetical protein
MTNYVWFFIFNSDDFEALELPSRTYTLILENIGQVDILVTKGNTIGITYNGIFLSLNMNDNNPFVMDGQAIYIDENNNVWLGLPVDEN